MKFLKDGSFNNNGLLQVILFLTLCYISLLWLTNILLYVERIGFTYTSVVNYYLGSEEEFRNPVSYMGLLETTHFHLFSFALLLIMLNHLMLFTQISYPVKMALIVTSFISAAMDMGAGWLVRFVSPIFAYTKIYSFWIFQVSTLFIIILSFASLGNRGCSKADNEES